MSLRASRAALVHKAAIAVHSARGRIRVSGAGRGRRGAASDVKACASHPPGRALGGVLAGVGLESCAVVRAVAAWFGPCVAAHIKSVYKEEVFHSNVSK